MQKLHLYVAIGGITGGQLERLARHGTGECRRYRGLPVVCEYAITELVTQNSWRVPARASTGSQRNTRISRSLRSAVWASLGNNRSCLVAIDPIPARWKVLFNAANNFGAKTVVIYNSNGFRPEVSAHIRQGVHEWVGVGFR